jgi:hypothetical protein
MNTLRELGNFVGIPQGSLEVARFGGPRITSLSMVNLLVTRRAKPASMRAIIQMLQNLTPITLEAQIVGSRSGEEPFKPVIHLNASGGITWHTNIQFNATSVSDDLSNAGGDFTPTQLGPGSYQFVVKRSGISNTGFVSLSKTLDTITVSARPQPPPPDPHPPPLVKPFIAVQSKGDGSFVVSGSNFLPNTSVFILVGDGTFRNPLVFTDTSNPEGKLVGFPTGKICQGPGQLFFEANDGRLNPSDRSTLMSNTVTTSCPF